MSKDAIADALRLAKRKKKPVRFHHTIAREGYQEGGVPDEAKHSERPPVSSEYLPITADDRGLHLDWNAGIPGKLKRAGQYFYDTMSGRKEMDPTSQEAVDAASTIAGSVTLGAGAGSAPANALRAGLQRSESPLAKTAGAAETMMGGMPQTGAIRAYHYSPHAIDKFETGHAGTGAGGSSFGHGLYFGEKEQDARMWQNKINEEKGLPKGSGHMYETELHVDPERMIDYNKFLHEQPEFVKNALQNKLGHDVPSWFKAPEEGEFVGGRPRGEMVVPRSEGAMNAMREAGIQGVRYYDPSNSYRGYVSFSGEPVEILRRYYKGGEVNDALRLARNKYATDGAVTPQASAEEPEAQAYGEVSFAPEYTPRPQEEVRGPDDTKQEAFIREELKGSAPQYDPSAETGLKNAAIAGAKWTAPGAAADAMGMLGGPSMAENIRQGRYLPAALQAVAVGLPTAMAGRAAINAGLGAGASKFTKLGKPDVFLAPGYVAEQTAEDWAPSVFGKETYEGAKAAGKKALEEGTEYIRRKIGYADGGEVADALRLAQVAKEKSDQLPMRMNYGVRHGSNDLKDIGFLGPLRQGQDKITEYSSERDFQYPSVYEGITPKDLAAVMFHERMTAPKYRGDDIISQRLNEAQEKAPQQDKIPFPEDVDDRAYAAAQRRVQEGRSPFYEPGRDPYPKWSPEQAWDEPAYRSYGGAVEDALRLAKQGGGSADTKTPPKNNYEALQDLLGRPRANTKTYEVPKDHPNYNVSPEEFHKGNLGKGRYALALGGSPFGAAQTAQPAAQPAAQPVAQPAPAQASASSSYAPQQAAYQPNYSSAQTQNQNHNYINSIYQNMFGRQADAGGLNYWANQLSSGASDPASMISQFAGSNEFQSRYAADPRQAVNSLYQTALGRQADAGGLDYWASQPAGSMDAVGLARQILSSREGQNAQDIQQQYLSNVGRVATPEQLAQAQQSYESGDVGSFNEQISNSPEARQYATNEGIKEAYQAYLGRDADPEGLKHFSDMVNSGKMSLLDAENIIKNSEEGQLYEASNFEPYQVASSDSVTPMPARPKFKTAESARQYIAEELRNMTPEQQRAVLAYAEGNGINTNRPENLAALMWSIQNRANAGFQEGHKDYWAKRNPNSVYDQMLAPAGFTSLTGRTLKHLQAGLNAIDAIKNNEKFQKEYGDIAEGVTSGRIADPTKGAVFYANPHGPGGGSFIRGLEARPKQYSSASGVEGPHRFFYGNQWTEAARKNAPQYQGDASVQQAGYVPPESNLPPQQSINTGPIGGTITNPVGSMYPLGAGGYEPPNQAFQPPPVPVAEPSAPHTPVHNTHAPHAPSPHAPTHHTNSGHGTDSTLHVLSGEGAGQSLSYHVPANHVPYNHIAHPGAGGFNHGHHGSSHHGGLGGHGYWDPNWANSSMHSGGDQSFFKSGGRVKRADGGDVMKDSQIEDALRIARQSGGKTPAWTRAEGKNPEGGLNAKGRASAKREGMNLKPPAPHPKTEKDAGRRKSFCSRMKGMKAKLTSAETARDPDSRINKSLRAWNCADGGAVENALKLAKGGEIWDKERPKGLGKPKKLSESQKSSAKAAAKAAGRPYPNMIDNINAAKKR